MDNGFHLTKKLEVSSKADSHREEKNIKLSLVLTVFSSSLEESGIMYVLFSGAHLQVLH